MRIAKRQQRFDLAICLRCGSRRTDRPTSVCDHARVARFQGGGAMHMHAIEIERLKKSLRGAVEYLNTYAAERARQGTAVIEENGIDCSTGEPIALPDSEPPPPSGNVIQLRPREVPAYDSEPELAPLAQRTRPRKKAKGDFELSPPKPKRKRSPRRSTEPKAKAKPDPSAPLFEPDADA